MKIIVAFVALFFLAACQVVPTERVTTQKDQLDQTSKQQATGDTMEKTKGKLPNVTQTGNNNTATFSATQPAEEERPNQQAQSGQGNVSLTQSWYDSIEIPMGVKLILLGIGLWLLWYLWKKLKESNKTVAAGAALLDAQGQRFIAHFTGKATDAMTPEASALANSNLAAVKGIVADTQTIAPTPPKI